MVFLQIFQLFQKRYDLVLIDLVNGVTSQEYEDNINVTLKRLRRSHLNNVIFPYLNINSIRNKFGHLDKIVDGNTDILRIAERTVNESFLNNQVVYQYYTIISP